MNLTTQRIKGFWRVVDAITNKIALKANGSPVDYGGYESQEQAMCQAKELNKNLAKKGFKT